MIAAYFVLLIPLAGIIFFAIANSKMDMGKINVYFNAICLLATLWLAINVLNQGTILSTSKAFLVDSFNVYLIVLTAFIGLTTSIFSAPYMAHEKEIGKLTDRRLKL